MTRIAIADLKQESNSFSPVPGDWPHFQQSGYLLRGSEILDQLRGTACEVGGALRVTDSEVCIRQIAGRDSGFGKVERRSPNVERRSTNVEFSVHHFALRTS